MTTGTMDGALSDIGISSMRQLASAVRGQTPELEIPSVAGVRGRPCGVPDCFTDGSLKQPQAEHCALGGAGLWMPSCNVGGQQLETLRDYAYVCTAPAADGTGRLQIKARAIMFGDAVSSTRAEIIGLLLALLVPVPIHVAVDNQGVVDVMTGIVTGALGIDPAKWAVHADGDLWFCGCHDYAMQEPQFRGHHEGQGPRHAPICVPGGGDGRSADRQ